MPPHPLAPLSPAEFLAARDGVLASHRPHRSLFFRSVTLHEPARAELRAFLAAEHAATTTTPPTGPATPPPRRAATVDYDLIPTDGGGSGGPVFRRALVDVTTGQVISDQETKTRNNARPYFVNDEVEHFEHHCLTSPVFQQAVKEFVLPPGFQYCIDPWPYGGPDDENDDTDAGFHPVMQGLVFARDATTDNPDSNHYAYPIPLIPVLDRATNQVIRVDRLPTGGRHDDTHQRPQPLSPPPPPPPPHKPRDILAARVPAEYVPELLAAPPRTDLQPLHVVQPAGASFRIHPDNLVEWQRWRFRLAFTPREGAVLHDVSHAGRSVLHRLSFSELTVPYADPRPPFNRKQAFDLGDVGIGRSANSLRLGCDCLGAVHYLDGCLTNPDGTPAPLRDAVCLHEQDGGILWKHTNFRTGRAVVARMRELVVQFVATLINYEYIFAFKFDQAGGITVETRATGVLSVVGIDDGKTSEYGNVVAPGVLAQNHQHIFAVRIDPAIDLYNNSSSSSSNSNTSGYTQVVVEESHAHEMNPTTNPHGNYYEVRRTPVSRAAWIDADARLHRTIRLENPARKNAISGRNVGYKLVAPATQMMLADGASRMARRAPFTQHDYWVTGHRDGEFWAAGEFTNQSTAEEGGVADMVRRADGFRVEAAEGVDGEAAVGEGTSDPVLWSVFGLTHNPRVEDWPVMPVEIHQMHLRPADFFEANPALDVPTEKDCKSVLVAAAERR